MNAKGLLLDIDNTLYDYATTHTYASHKVLEYCQKELDIEIEILKIAYDKARKRVHLELAETASSHNRLLYFQKMLEILQINPLKKALDIYNIYWDNFLEFMTPFEGIYELLEKYKGNICLVTDLTAHIQYRKIKKLKLENYVDKIVTSEEIGHEKPHPYMFITALKKINLREDEIYMIGDNFQKDIVGALNLGLKSIWLNSQPKQENYDKTLVQEVKEFKEILELI